ncbi:MAG: hypothetical protein ABSB97_03300 [Thermoplasmata archaeon]|jgi:hypothetical protein
MEARDGARRVTQRQLAVADEASSEAPPPPVAPWAASPEMPPPPSPPLPPISHEPSDLALRDRQARWMRERARFEAADHKPVPPGEGPK